MWGSVGRDACVGGCAGYNEFDSPYYRWWLRGCVSRYPDRYVTLHQTRIHLTICRFSTIQVDEVSQQSREPFLPSLTNRECVDLNLVSRSLCMGLCHDTAIVSQYIVPNTAIMGNISIGNVRVLTIRRRLRILRGEIRMGEDVRVRARLCLWCHIRGYGLILCCLVKVKGIEVRPYHLAGAISIDLIITSPIQLFNLPSIS